MTACQFAKTRVRSPLVAVMSVNVPSPSLRKTYCFSSHMPTYRSRSPSASRSPAVIVPIIASGLMSPTAPMYSPPSPAAAVTSVNVWSAFWRNSRSVSGQTIEGCPRICPWWSLATIRSSPGIRVRTVGSTEPAAASSARGRSRAGSPSSVSSSRSIELRVGLR